MKRYLFGSLACVVLFGLGAMVGILSANSASAQPGKPDVGIPAQPPMNAFAQLAHNEEANQPRDSLALTPWRTPGQQEQRTLRFNANAAQSQLLPVRNDLRSQPRFTDAAPSLGSPQSFGTRQADNFPSSTPLVTLDVMEGMSFALQVSRKADGTSPPAHQETRLIGGTQISYAHLGNIFGAQQWKIFAESMELTNDGDDFKLKCQGKVVVITNQSMLRGEGLEYANGEFKISSPDITTPDTEIHAANSTFAYPIGAVTVYRLPGRELKPVDAVNADGPAEAALPDAIAPDVWPSIEPNPSPPQFEAAELE